MRLTEGQRDRDTEDALQRLVQFTTAVRNAYAHAKDVPGEHMGEILDTLQGGGGRTFIDDALGYDEGGILYGPDGQLELRPRPQRYVNPMRRQLTTTPSPEDSQEAQAFYEKVFRRASMPENSPTSSLSLDAQ